MASLTAKELSEVREVVVGTLCAANTTIPTDNKAVIDSVIASADAAVESSEGVFVNSLAAGAKAWLMANQPVGRLVLEQVTSKRKDVL